MDSNVEQATLLAYLVRWNRAVQRQAIRTLEQSFSVDREMDAVLFAVALRNVLRVHPGH
jgi:hypothetical protein